MGARRERERERGGGERKDVCAYVCEREKEREGEREKVRVEKLPFTKAFSSMVILIFGASGDSSMESTFSTCGFFCGHKVA